MAVFVGVDGSDGFSEGFAEGLVDGFSLGLEALLASFDGTTDELALVLVELFALADAPDAADDCA